MLEGLFHGNRPVSAKSGAFKGLDFGSQSQWV